MRQPHPPVRAALIALGMTLVLACAPNTDLTVAPPPQPTQSAVVIPPPREDGRLPPGVQPTRYRLALDIDPGSDGFTGEVGITIDLDAATSAIVLHAAELSITRAEVVVGDSVLTAETSRRRASGATTNEEELVVVTSAELPAGSVELRLSFAGTLSEALVGMYRVEDGGEDYVFTQLEPSDARRVFPCFDDPIFKVPFDVSVTAPADDRVFANTPELSAEPDGERITHTFATTKPLPTYLVALAMGPLDVLEGPQTPVPLRLITARGKSQSGKLALATAAAQLPLLGNWFGHPYPYAKLDLVAVPNFGPGAMENAGLVTFREELLLVDGGSAMSRRDMVMTMAHELSHQWFGNLVTMKWWDDLWLNEGFASYLETVIADEQEPETRAELDLLSLSGWVMDLDALQSSRRVRQPVSNTYQAWQAFDGITYVKGASVIRMLHDWLGDEPFRHGIRNYVERHAFGNASAADVFASLSATSGHDVAMVASTFLDQPGVPLVTARLACDGAPAVELTQAPYQREGSRRDDTVAPARWNIPVCVAYPTTPKADVLARTCGLLEGQSLRLELAAKGCPSFLIPNAGHAGYYRYALDERALGDLLTAARGFDTATKIGALSNLWALVEAGQISPSLLIDSVVAFRADPDREVVEELIKLLSHIEDALVEPSAASAFERLVEAVILPRAKRLGWEARPDDDSERRLLRRALLGSLLAHSRDPWFIKGAEKRAAAWLTDPKSVDPDIAALALRASARLGTVRFADLERRLEAAKDVSERVVLVQALGSLRDPAELTKSFDLLLTGTIRAQDAVYLSRTASEWSDSRKAMITWVSQNLDGLAAKVPGFGVSRMVTAVRRLCDQPSLERVTRAVEPQLGKVPASERHFRQAVENAELCIALRKRQGAAASDYLRKKRQFR